MFRVVRSSRFFRGSGLYAFRPVSAERQTEPLHLRIWNRHFVTTKSSSQKQDSSDPLFGGRQPEWYLANDDVRIALESEDDFRTTFDVYVGGHYDRLNKYATPGSVVWDIGANLGVASLIFAQNPNVSHVYAYEPLPETFTLTKRSVAANPKLSFKIDVENLGIGKSDCELQVSYTSKVKAAIGIAAIPSRLKDLYHVGPEDMKNVTIRLSDAAKALRSIRAKHPGAPILLKLDAEGVEYEIIDRFIETGIMQEITAAAIEWHDSPGEGYLTSRLRASGFQTEARALEADGSIGIIDAWR
jgi:FkbM family methyltransferase